MYKELLIKKIFKNEPLKPLQPLFLLSRLILTHRINRLYFLVIPYIYIKYNQHTFRALLHYYYKTYINQ